ncbi:MAG: hypothetical protein HKN23_07500 [Verrucomicrobiales bacterium]|nr:hypothetical protein [Verrucomicrobiales bacterium]
MKVDTPTQNEESTRKHGYSLEAVDVTGTNSVEVRGVAPSIPTRDITGVFASELNLSSDVAWMLRSDRTGSILDEETPIGEQVESGSRVVLTPKTHLGGNHDLDQ